MPIDRPLRMVLLVALVGIAYTAVIANVVNMRRARLAGAVAQEALSEFLDNINHSMDESVISELESASTDEVARMCGLDPSSFAVRGVVLYHDGTSWVEFSTFGAAQGLPMTEASTAQGYAAWLGADRSPVVLIRLTVAIRARG